MNTDVPVPNTIKQEGSRKVESLLSRRFRPALKVVSAAGEQHGFTHVVDVFSEWRGDSLYVCAKYREMKTRDEAEFYTAHKVRIRHLQDDRFVLSYMDEEGQWRDVFEGLTLEECLERIESDDRFWPL